MASFWAGANPAILNTFLFEEEAAEECSRYSLGLISLRDWLVFDFPTEAVDSLVAADAKPILRDQVLATGDAMGLALGVLSDSHYLNDNLFLNLAKCASTAQTMKEHIKKNYPPDDNIAQKKLALTEKWEQDEQSRLRREATEKQEESRDAVRVAAEHVYTMLCSVPETSWGPVMCRKMNEWAELEATQMEAIKVAQAKLQNRVRQSATPQKADKDVELEASYRVQAKYTTSTNLTGLVWAASYGFRFGRVIDKLIKYYDYFRCDF